MAIQNEDIGITQPEQPTQQFQPSQQTAQQPKTAETTWSFDSGELFGAPIPKTVYNEYYTKMKEGLTEIYRHSNKDVEVALLDLDNINNPGLAYSSIIVAVRSKKDPTSLAYHILVLEATGDTLHPAFVNIGGLQTKVLRFSCNALDDVLREKAHKKIVTAYNVSKIYYSEGTVIPEAFNPEDKRKLHMIALNTGLACTTELRIRSSDFHDLNLALVPKDKSLFVSIDFSKQQIEDPVGNVTRSDVTTTFGTRKQVASSQSVNVGEKESNLAVSSGFIDLLWAPANPQASFNPYVNQTNNFITQKYAARLVITNLASSFSYTPAMILLALATTVSIRNNNNWINTFRSSPIDEGSIDLRDIGALNIESNLENDPSGWGKHIDTKSETFQLGDLGQLISTLIRSGLVVSLDCPEGGPQGWYLSMFASASRGVPAATELIYSAAQQLTNGCFGKYFSRETPIFGDPFNTVHLGYWIDRKGQKRDIRDIDHLAVCNISGERSPDLIRGYSDTFLRKDIPLIKRLADRSQLIQALTNETAVFTGYADRVTFTSMFIDALSKGIADTALEVRIASQVLDDINTQRGYADFIGNTLLTGDNGFTTYNTYQGASQGYMGYQGSRW